MTLPSFFAASTGSGWARAGPEQKHSTSPMHERARSKRFTAGTILPTSFAFLLRARNGLSHSASRFRNMRPRGSFMYCPVQWINAIVVMQPHPSMPHLKTKDAEIYYEVHGAGPPVLFCSVTGCDHQAWKFHQVPEFSRDHRVIVFDYRGTGRSTKTVQNYSIVSFAEDAV